MDIKKYFEFFGFNEKDEDEDKLSEQSELAKDISSSIDMLIEIIEDQEDIKKLQDVEQILKKYK